MHNTDTRCAFVDWLDGLSKSGEVSDKLANRATLHKQKGPTGFKAGWNRPERSAALMTYKRKTRDLFDIEGLYSYGWESVTCEETRKDARERLKEYKENEPGTAFRLRKYREPIETAVQS